MMTQENERTRQIAQAAQEQKQGIALVSEAVNQIDTVTQRNAASGEQSAGAAQELKAQAQRLQSIVEELLTLVRGRHI
jgi:methyl-accepting chemotaxis protein